MFLAAEYWWLPDGLLVVAGCFSELCIDYFAWGSQECEVPRSPTKRSTKRYVFKQRGEWAAAHLPENEERTRRTSPTAKRPARRLSAGGGLWYPRYMSRTPTLPSAPTFTGHVRNGVIILDTDLVLSEGQAVRVEPLGSTPAITDERATQLRRMETLFNRWDEEDGRLSDDEADRLGLGLQQNGGLTFRTPRLG